MNGSIVFRRAALLPLVLGAACGPADPGRGGMAVGIPLYPRTDWGFTPDGHFVYGTTDPYRIMIGRHGTDTLRIIEASGEGRPATAAERDSLLQATLPPGVSARDAFRRVAKPEDIPERWPAWSGDRVYLRDEDAEGRPLIRVYRLERGSATL